MMVSVNSMRVMEVLSDATNTIAEGEVLQLMNCHDANIDEDNYLKVIRYKTAKLFEAAGRLGAIVSGAPRQTEDALGVYGMHLGTAFQLVDDVLDYSGEHRVTGKNIGDDLAEGKPTLPLIYAMRVGKPDQEALIRRAIEEGGMEDFGAVLEAVRQTRALDYTRNQAAQEAEYARNALILLPDTKYRAALLELATFAVSRDH
jgi:octaprenyl-diphosphate synthase